MATKPAYQISTDIQHRAELYLWCNGYDCHLHRDTRTHLSHSIVCSRCMNTFIKHKTTLYTSQLPRAKHSWEKLKTIHVQCAVVLLPCGRRRNWRDASILVVQFKFHRQFDKCLSFKLWRTMTHHNVLIRAIRFKCIFATKTIAEQHMNNENITFAGLSATA